MRQSAPQDVASAVRQAVREAIAGTLRAWVEQITENELRSDEIREQIRPLLVALVRRELEAALRQSNGRRRRRR